jgi:hypothetical protein
MAVVTLFPFVPSSLKGANQAGVMSRLRGAHKELGYEHASHGADDRRTTSEPLD